MEWANGEHKIKHTLVIMHARKNYYEFKYSINIPLKTEIKS